MDDCKRHYRHLESVMAFEVMRLRTPASVQQGLSHKDEAARVSCFVGVRWSKVEEKWAHQQEVYPYDVGVYLAWASPPGKRKVVQADYYSEENRDTVGSRVYPLGTNRIVARICPAIWMVPGARPIEISLPSTSCSHCWVSV